MGADFSYGVAAKVSNKLSPGEHEVVCTGPGHEEGGRKGDLTVR